jgi:5'-phosphate synthase pdxT subunit
VHAVFIRAPVIESVGDGVEVLAAHRGKPVVVRQDNILAATFHPELAHENGLHRLLVDTAR